MSIAFTVRAIRPDDFAAWLPLWDGYNAFYGRAGAAALPEANTRCTWARFFDPAEPVNALVAERDGELLGLVHFIYHRNTILIGPICYLQDLFTVDSARGQGVGRALIMAVNERARADGAERVYWQTHETNSTAMELYDKLATRTGFLVYRQNLS